MAGTGAEAPAPGCVTSGDTAARPKPHANPLLHACALLRSEPARCWYLGDHARDILAGAAAGMATLTAGWGDLGSGAPPADWGAEAIVQHPLAVLEWLRPGLGAHQSPERRPSPGPLIQPRASPTGSG